ncbi:GYF domain-containing protein [Roseovarius sp. Pro17]|uniref:GYF domain-containing protein n=1 Tax=Roseovarius sp. Pro17 TaxID=3108175 RepID=UPI002D78B370|nr:GYF domain-containing protein [Roseovarius sp. Pro17]
MSDNSDLPTDSVPEIAPNRMAAPVSRPPHPMDATWLMRVDGQEYGPYTGHDLKEFADEGRLEMGTEVMRDGGFAWMPARKDVTLGRFFKADERPPLRADAAESVSTGDRSTVVQVHNTVHAATVPLDVGADKSPGVALVLSLLFCGLGQLYNGDVGKGILMFFMCILLWAILLGWIINLWSIFDAYGRAKELRTRYNAHQLHARAL